MRKPVSLLLALVTFSQPATSQTFEREPVFSIGAVNEPAAETFGFISDLQLTPNGDLFLLDEQSFEIHRFTLEGEYLGRVGRHGQGPGEVREARGFAVDTTGLIHVADPGNARISIFRIQEQRLDYVGSQRMTAMASGLCFAGTRRFVLTHREDPMIREVDQEGAVINEFGGPVELDRGLAQAFGGQPPFLLNDGLLHCDPPGESIYYSSLRLGEIRRYSLDGVLIWQTRLRDFLRLELSRSKSMDACCNMKPNSATNTFHMLVEVAAYGAHLFVSLHEWGPEDVSRYEVRVLRASNGAEIGALPASMAIATFHSGLAIGYSQTPYPRVLAYAIDDDLVRQ